MSRGMSAATLMGSRGGGSYKQIAAQTPRPPTALTQRKAREKGRGVGAQGQNSLKSRRESIAQNMVDAGMGFEGFDETELAKRREGVGGTTGCLHKHQYTGTWTADKHRPGFSQQHGEAPLGYEWAICASPFCDWRALRCIDPEAASTAVTPVRDADGRVWYTIRQVCTLLGWTADRNHEVRVGTACRTGKLTARKLGEGSWGVWLVLADSIVPYAEALEQEQSSLAYA